jgi:hypothetical protein
VLALLRLIQWPQWLVLADRLLPVAGLLRWTLQRWVLALRRLTPAVVAILSANCSPLFLKPVTRSRMSKLHLLPWVAVVLLQQVQVPWAGAPADASAPASGGGDSTPKAEKSEGESESEKEARAVRNENCEILKRAVAHFKSGKFEFLPAVGEKAKARRSQMKQAVADILGRR